MLVLVIFGLTIVTIVIGLCVTEINAEGNTELSIVLLIATYYSIHKQNSYSFRCI